MAKVLVGLSGGVDSAVAAALLYAGRKLAANKKKADEPASPGSIPSGEPPQTD